jgi:hypothetical protein
LDALQYCREKILKIASRDIWAVVEPQMVQNNLLSNMLKRYNLLLEKKSKVKTFLVLSYHTGTNAIR